MALEPCSSAPHEPALYSLFRLTMVNRDRVGVGTGR